MRFVDQLEARRLFSADLDVATLITRQGDSGFRSATGRLILYTSRIPTAPTVSAGVIHVDGSSKNDDFFIERTSGAKPLLTTRYFAVFDSNGTLISQQGASNGPTIRQGSELTLVYPGNFIHVHNGPNDIYIKDSAIRGVEVAAGAGNDRVRIASNLKLPTTLLGGAGDDTLLGGLRPDTIDGGDGNDHIVGGRFGSSNNVVTGGNGEDTIVASSTADRVTYPEDGVVDHITYLVEGDQSMGLFSDISSAPDADDINTLKNILTGRVVATWHTHLGRGEVIPS
jgi:Ca2+-binding RTX toxin-like protein